MSTVTGLEPVSDLAPAERGLAADLLAARASRARMPTAAGRLAGFDLERAYRVAAFVRDLRAGRGEIPVGRKLGFTNRGIWPEYGVQAPMWAHMYDTTVYRIEDHRAVIDLSRFAAPRLEPEIVVHFHRAPPARVANDRAGHLAILECVDWIAHGIEIVDCHIADWQFTIADTVAEFGLHAALHIGKPQSAGELAESPAGLLDALAGFGLELRRNGETIDRGRGANVLDSPIAALAHTLGVIAHQPQFAPIGAGEIITTGTVTRAWPIQTGEAWSTLLQGIRLPGLALTFV